MNKVDVGEGHKKNGKIEGNSNLTELYIENGIHISIHKLILQGRIIKEAAASAGGGNTRRRHRKRNTKNSRKRKFKKLSRFY